MDYSDFRDAASELTKAGFEKQAGRTVAWGLKQAANAVRRNVRAMLKPHNKTGKMRDRVRTRFVGHGMGFVAGVKTTGSGSNLVIGGVAPHRIAPGRVMPLWEGKGTKAGITGFARAVEHPGFPADPFFRKGINASTDEIQAILRRSTETMAKELAYRTKKGKR